jgi:hypothetical protein
MDVGEGEASGEILLGVAERERKPLMELKQVFCGAQHDEENSLLFWGLPIVEDGEADFGRGRG